MTGDGDAVAKSLPATLPLIRPLLGWRRHDLRAIAAASGLPFVDDPSNGDGRFDRARIRHWLAQAPWLDPRQIGRSAEHVADAEADFVALSHWLWQERALDAPPHEARFDIAGLPRGVRRYIARMAIDTVRPTGGFPLGGLGKVGNIEALLDALEAGRGAEHDGVRASARADVWRFRRAPPRRAG